MNYIALLLVGSLLTGGQLLGQGTIDFRNRVTDRTPTIDAPIFDSDGSRLEGNTALAQLYVANISDEIFFPVDEPIGFLNGAEAGYVNTGEFHDIIVQFMAPGAYGFAQVRAWKEAPSWEQAIIRGESNILPVHLGGLTFTAPHLVGLESFRLVPEPGTVFLAVLGGTVLFLLRIKSRR